MGNTSRKNIFELMQEKYDLANEVVKIEDLLDEDIITLNQIDKDNGACYEIGRFTLEECASEFFLHKWKHCGSCIDCDEIRDSLNISSLLNTCKSGFGVLKETDIINYIEYILNISNLYNIFNVEDDKAIYFDKNYEILIRNINILLDHINYEAKNFKNEQRILVVEKNAAATSVAEIVEDDLSFKVIEYNHNLLKGNLNRKKAILKDLADKMESLTDKYDTPLSKDIGFLVNNINIRHNNLEGKSRKEYIVNMKDEELEEWYDETYQLMLLYILENEYKSNSQAKIKQLKKDMNKIK